MKKSDPKRIDAPPPTPAMQGRTTKGTARPSATLATRYRLIMDHARDIILFVRRRDGGILEANAAALKTYGYTRDEILRLTIFDLRIPKERRQVSVQMEKADIAPSGILFETVHIRKDGTTFPVEVSSRSIHIGSEAILLSIVRDIADRKKTEEKMRSSEETLRALVNATAEAFFLMNTNGVLLQVNEAMTRWLGFEHPEEIIGKNHYDLVPAIYAAQSRAQVDKVLQTGKPLRFEDRRGGRHINHVLYPLFDDAGRVDRIAAFGSDITEYRRLEEKLHLQALTDQLTGLYNRRGFYFLAEQQLKVAKRTGGKIVLFYIDLDGMKEINDTLGHAEGDKALIAAARILRETFREADTIARLGGDEFAVLAVNIKAEFRRTLIDRLYARINTYNAARTRRKFKLSMSLGIAEFQKGNAASLQDLISRADKLMYLQKKKKKG